MTPREIKFGDTEDDECPDCGSAWCPRGTECPAGPDLPFEYGWATRDDEDLTQHEEDHE